MYSIIVSTLFIFTLFISLSELNSLTAKENICVKDQHQLINTCLK